VGNGLADEGVGLRHSAAILGCDLRQVNESKCFGDKLNTRAWETG